MNLDLIRLAEMVLIEFDLVLLSLIMRRLVRLPLVEVTVCTFFSAGGIEIRGFCLETATMLVLVSILMILLVLSAILHILTSMSTLLMKNSLVSFLLISLVIVVLGLSVHPLILFLI